METTAMPVLKPLRLAELLDQAVRLYRRNFLSFLGIIAVVYIPYALLQVTISLVSTSSLQNARSDMQNYVFSTGYWLTILGSILLPFLRFVIVNGLGTAVLTYAIARNYLGYKVGILDAYQQLGSLWLRLLATLFLFSLVLIGVVIWWVVPCVGWLTGFGLLVFLMGVVGQLIPSVLVIEKLGPPGSLSRAWDLARRRFWWLLGFAVILYLFNALVAGGPTLLISYLVGLVFGHGSSGSSVSTVSTVSALASVVPGALIELIILPLQLTAWTLVYFDLRVRTEGFDLALLTMNPADESALDFSHLPAAVPSQKWLTGDDVGKIIVVTFIGIGIYALLIGLLAMVGVGLSSFRGF